jgi:hypothetical protein
LVGIRLSDGVRPRDLAETILSRAMELDRNRPNDDMSVIVLGVLPCEDTGLRIRRMSIDFPLDPLPPGRA